MRSLSICIPTLEHEGARRMATGTSARTLKAFRPGYFGSDDDYDEENRRVKDINLERYAKRVEKGQSIFEVTRKTKGGK